MHADQLRVAVDKVVNTLTTSNVMTAIRDYRTAKGDQRPVAAARLGHAGAMLMESLGRVSPEEASTLQLLHLQNLREPAYWQDLLSPQKPEQQRTAELVHLYSRVMFATSHLPNFAALLGRVDSAAPLPKAAVGAGVGAETAALQPGESRITVQLTDAGERASDPDRIARSIDGIDMLYSACASLSRRPAMDLRLDHVAGSNDRSIVFTGETDSISAMSTVIDSIPETLASLNDDQEIDLDQLVDSLPIFDQLATLAGRGAFSENDLKDIRETMHQGALLTLESGVVMPEPPVSGAQAQNTNNQQATAQAEPMKPSLHQRQAPQAAQAVNAENAAQAGQPQQAQQPIQLGAAPQQAAAATQGQNPPQNEPFRDEHYERYLKERAAMQSSGGNGVITSAPDDPFPMLGNAVNADSTAETDKQAAMDELLKNLNRQRDG